MIKISQGNLLRWFLAGGAFLVVVGAAGCGSSKQTPPDPSVAGTPPVIANPQASAPAPAGQTPAVLEQPSPAIDQGDSKPTTVNVFGEIDGVERSAAHPYGKSGFEQHTFVDEGYDADVNLDPTGKWMVFTSTRHSEHPNIYMQRVDGMSVIELTNDQADYANPVFSPDGKRVAFASTRGGNWDIYLMDVDGKNVVQVTTGPMQHVHPSFSPDGGRLVFSTLGVKSAQWELWTVDLSTGEKRMIGFGLFPTWSPAKDVDRIAFQRARQRGGRWFSLWTLDLVNGEAQRVTEVAVSANAAIVSPSWSPDGTQLAFATITEPANTSGVKAVGQQDIWTINSDGSNRHRLTDGVGMNLSPCWSSSNQIYFVSDRTGTECIWSVKSDQPALAPKVADDGGQ